MPPKVREIIKELEKAGFINRGGKGDHRIFFIQRLQNQLPYRAKLVMMLSIIK